SRAEWYVGTRGGSMDHTTILLARPDSAINISYSDNGSGFVGLPPSGYLWITFFTHPANKGREVMNQYNDRAMASRILIPAILKDWRAKRAAPRSAFSAGVRQLKSGDVSGIELIENALRELPDSIGPGRLRDEYPAAFEDCSQAFPALITEVREEGFAVRKRALHHIGEVKRVARAANILKL